MGSRESGMDIELGGLGGNTPRTGRVRNIKSSWILEMYKAATEDDEKKLEDMLEQAATEKKLSRAAVLYLARPLGNTLLHTAAKFGSRCILSLLLECYPLLLYKTNSKGDTALHVAAKHGHKEIAEALIQFERVRHDGRNSARKYTRYHLFERLADETGYPPKQLLEMLENQKIKCLFDTLLIEEEIGYEHITQEETLAMLYDSMKQSVWMISSDSWELFDESKVSFRKKPVLGKSHWKESNHEDSCFEESKIEASLVSLRHGREEPLAMLQNQKGNTALHDAIICRQEEVVSFLIDLDPKVWLLLNCQEQSTLCLAVEAGFEATVEVMLRDWVDVENFRKWHKPKQLVIAAIVARNEDILVKALEKERRLICLRDADGKSVLHYAASMGYLKSVEYLVGVSSTSAIERDADGMLPIHLASKAGHVDIIEKLLPYYPDMVEMTDFKGRNILHVASKSGKTDVVHYILKNRKLQMLVNQKDDDGNTPLHLATKHCRPKIVSGLIQYDGIKIDAINNEGLTALDTAEQSMEDTASLGKVLTWTILKAGGAFKSPIVERKERLTTKCKRGGINSRTTKMAKYKDRIDTLLLVSILVATVTFAAGFTMPGGYNNSNPDEGIATMVKNSKLHLFVFCDSIAMYCSIMVALTLFWGQLGDFNLMLTALRLAVPLLGISLTTMSLAFIAGVYLVVGKLSWLANTVLIIGLVFLVLQTLLFLPLWLPIQWNNRFFLYVFRYLLWLLLATGCWDEDWDDKPRALHHSRSAGLRRNGGLYADVYAI